MIVKLQKKESKGFYYFSGLSECPFRVGEEEEEAAVASFCTNIYLFVFFLVAVQQQEVLFSFLF